MDDSLVGICKIKRIKKDKKERINEMELRKCGGKDNQYEIGKTHRVRGIGFVTRRAILVRIWFINV